MIKIKIRSLDQESILLYKKFISEIISKLNLPFTTSNMPNKKKRVTLLKSPHVNKKAREQFQITTYKTSFEIESAVNIKVLKYIILNKPKTVKVSLFQS
jgi:small subunit ribosomal protein S10